MIRRSSGNDAHLVPLYTPCLNTDPGTSTALSVLKSLIFRIEISSHVLVAIRYEICFYCLTECPSVGGANRYCDILRSLLTISLLRSANFVSTIFGQTSMVYAQHAEDHTTTTLLNTRLSPRMSTYNSCNDGTSARLYWC